MAVNASGWDDQRVEAREKGSRPGNYTEEARTYDLTRGASPTVVRVASRFLGPAAGRKLLDIAGGTGNYAQVFRARGFDVVVLDAEPAMAERSVRKIGRGRQVVGDAAGLPFADAAFDTATLIHAVHLLAEPAAALREARRVIGAGPLVLVDPVRENAPLFVHEYFGLQPSEDSRPGRADISALLIDSGFSRVEDERLVYTDTADGSLYALHTNALHLAGPAYLRNTTFWHQLDPETRRLGLEALAHALRSGELAERVRNHLGIAAERGHETVFAAWP
jgi:SAM-dependent methyltransferase